MSNFHLTPSNTLPPPHTSRDYERTMRATLSLAAGRSAGEVHTPVTRPAAPALRAPQSAITAAATAIDTVPLKRLTAGRKALKIAHAGETYLLRITKANKLILTKPAVEEKTPLDAKA